jgi:hypothetical protein
MDVEEKWLAATKQVKRYFEGYEIGLWIEVTDLRLVNEYLYRLICDSLRL